MTSLARPVAFVAALLIAPSLAIAGPHDAFKKPAKTMAGPKAAEEITNPGLWFTLKNTCPDQAYGAVADNICLKAIGTAVFTTKIRTGTVAKGYSEDFDICADKTSGNGEIIFVPSAGEAKDAVVVAVKPSSVVSYPETFCKK
jgi:hypothetical protein